MCPRISRWFLLVFCFLYLYLLLGGASLAHCPARPLYSFPSLFSFLSLVSHSHFVLGLILPLASLGALSQFSPFWGQPGHTVQLVTPLSPLRTILLRFSLLSTLRHLLPFSKGVCPKRLRPTWLHLMTQSGF